MISWIKKNRLEFSILVAVILGALFLRLFHIDQVMTFLGDQGRDARIVRDIITQGKIPLTGPTTSIGNIYLGPLYYYLMAPALLLSDLNPVGPVIMVIFLNVLTIIITWFVARKWFGKIAAFISAFLYAISPVAIDYSQCSWNPNPLPLFSLICIWGIYQVLQHKKYFWLPIVGASAAFALQMHYTAILLLPTLSLFWFLSLQKIKKQKSEVKIFVKNTILGTTISLILMSPLFYFDLINKWTNFQAFLSVFSVDTSAFNLSHFSSRFYSIFSLSASLLIGNTKNEVFFAIVSCLIAIFFLYKNRHQNPTKLISAWLFFTVIGLSFLKYPVFIHYLGIIFPTIFIIFGAFFAQIIKNKWSIKWLPLTILILITVNNLRICPTFGTPIRHLQRTEKIANLIINESKGESFSLDVVSKQNYDESYLYFLKENNSKKYQNDILAKQIFIICEEEVGCDIESLQQSQKAAFAATRIENHWNIDNIKVYRLIHTK